MKAPLVFASLLAFVTGRAVCQDMTFDQIRDTLHNQSPTTGDPLLREEAILALDEYLKPLAAETHSEIAEFYSGMVSTLPYDLSQPVPSGARIWKMYNHGFIVKTPSSVFAFDLVGGREFLSKWVPFKVLEQIDVVFVSHDHSDHSNTYIHNVVSEFGGEVMTTNNFPLDTEATVAGLNVVAHLGGHSIPNYIFTITTSEGLTFMHTGDTQHSGYLRNDVPIDVMLVNAWMNESGSRSATVGVRNAVRRVSPTLTLTGHEHELGHSYNPLNPTSRVPYEWPLAVDDEPVPGEVNVMTWGERYDLQVEPLVYRPPNQLSLALQSLYTVSDNDFDSVFDNLGDHAINLLQPLAWLPSVGEVEAGRTDEVSRFIAQFTLPDIPAERAADLLKRARLRYFLEDIDGTPAGPVSLFHSVSDNGITPPYRSEVIVKYEDATYVDTQLDLVGPTDEGGRYFELDVTEQVLADFAADGYGAITAFRLQVNEASFVEDGQGHNYQFAMLFGNEANPPQLILTFVPEPSTLLLSLLGLTVVGFSHRRSSKSQL